ncbi:MAG: nucleoside-triphosphatase [Bacillota bacterium]
MKDEKNLFLIGPRHVGKSTILSAALERVSVPVGGFHVDRVYEGRRLRAFCLVDLMSGDSAIIASARKGGWDVHVEGFETVGAEAIRRAMSSARLIVMDELGRFELRATMFREAVMEALSSPIPVVGVLKADGNPFLDAIRVREDTVTVEVTPSNRGEVALRLNKWLISSQCLEEGQIPPS